MTADDEDREIRRHLVGVLAEHLVHEVANRLAVTRLMAESLAARADLPADVGASVETIVTATNVASVLVEQLTTIAGRRPTDAHRVDVGQVVLELGPLLRAALGRRGLELSAGPGTVLADQRDVEELVLRMALGGTGTAPVEMVVGEAGGAVVLRLGGVVPDSFPDSTFDRIDELVDRVRGDLELAAGGLTLRMPAARCDKAAARPSRSGGAVVLVVEDDPDLRDLVRSALVADGHHVEAVGDVAAALDHPFVVDGKLELLLTDIELPGGSGLDLASDLARRSVRVLVMSGHRSMAPSDVPPGAGVLHKPFGVPALRQRVREALS